MLFEYAENQNGYSIVPRHNIIRRRESSGIALRALQMSKALAIGPAKMVFTLYVL